MKKAIFLLVFTIIVFYIWNIPLDTPIPGVDTYNKIGYQMESMRSNPIGIFLGILSLFGLLYMAIKFAWSRLNNKL